MKTGAFYQAKAFLRPDRPLACLNRVQGWVVRKKGVTAEYPRRRDPSDLDAMLASHERNVDRMAVQLPQPEIQGGVQ